MVLLPIAYRHDGGGKCHYTVCGRLTFRLRDAGVFSGVVVLQGNKVWGGDSQFYYIGTYKEDGDKIEADVDCPHHAGAMSTAFGTNEANYSLKMDGQHKGDLVTGKIWLPGNPNLKLDLQLVRRTGASRQRTPTKHPQPVSFVLHRLSLTFEFR